MGVMQDRSSHVLSVRRTLPGNLALIPNRPALVRLVCDPLLGAPFSPAHEEDDDGRRNEKHSNLVDPAHVGEQAVHTPTIAHNKG